MLSEKIHEILNINDSYKAPEKIMELLFGNKEKLEKVYESFSELFNHSFDHDWFHEYFQEESAERKRFKQDFTPPSVVQLINDIADTESTKNVKYFELAVGTGGIMIETWKRHKDGFFVLEELSDRTVPFLLFNMAIRNMNGIVRHGDSLKEEWTKVYRITSGIKYSKIEIIDNPESVKSNRILINPPYSIKWDQDKKEHFLEFVKLAPKSKADYAFLISALKELEEGILIAILPHGVLFRGAAELAIRKEMIERNLIHAVIGLPGKLFYNTDIPTAAIVFKKNREEDDIHFIDSSDEFVKAKNKNYLSEENIKKILTSYKNREFIDKFSNTVNKEEVVENDYNLNIPRYVNKFEEEEPIDIVELSKEMQQINKEIAEAEKEFLAMLDELQVTDESREIIQATKDMFRNTPEWSR